MKTNEIDQIEFKPDKDDIIPLIWAYLGCIVLTILTIIKYNMFGYVP